MAGIPTAPLGPDSPEPVPLASLPLPTSNHPRGPVSLARRLLPHGQPSRPLRGQPGDSFGLSPRGCAQGPNCPPHSPPRTLRRARRSPINPSSAQTQASTHPVEHQLTLPRGGPARAFCRVLQAATRPQPTCHTVWGRGAVGLAARHVHVGGDGLKGGVQLQDQPVELLDGLVDVQGG